MNVKLVLYRLIIVRESLHSLKQSNSTLIISAEQNLSYAAPFEYNKVMPSISNHLKQTRGTNSSVQ